MTLKTKIDAIVENVARTKADFEDYIKNEQNPLDERWEFWCAAPDYLKEHSRYAVDVPIEGLEKMFVYNGIYHCERHATIQMSAVPEVLVEAMEWSPELSITLEMIAQFKEFVLQNNLGSFVYDW